ncbi:MerR family transcriptional regulator [Streptomyces sparsogenes]|uniref:MerR family transcriptional regulator n=1 Tax=Streptomyces sparsogenes TaxID=67365 RepID=UPI00331FB454
MRLRELSERSGVPTATIKYYLRERLLPPGERVSATQAEYGEEHLRRLRLVRALIQVGRVPVATAREVLETAEDESLSQNTRMGAAVWALPHGPEPAEDDPETAEATRQVDALLERLGWTYGQQLGATSPAYRMLVAAIASLERLGYPHDTDHLALHARLAAELAVADLDLVEKYGGSPTERIEAVVALTVLYEPVLLALRRLAETEESGRRFTDSRDDSRDGS